MTEAERFKKLRWAIRNQIRLDRVASAPFILPDKEIPRVNIRAHRATKRMRELVGSLCVNSRAS